MSAKQALIDKLQGSVAADLRCGGVVNYHIKKGLLLSLRMKKLSTGEYLANKLTSKHVIVSCAFFVFQQSVGQARKVHETTTLLFVTLPNIHRLKRTFHSQTAKRPRWQEISIDGQRRRPASATAPQHGAQQQMRAVSR